MIERELADYLIVSGVKAALAAGNEIMKLYNSSDEIDVNLNANNTVVTEADRVAHETIKRSLSPTRIPIMSEEGRNILFEERYSWELYWLVDPLDGTREFIKHNGEFVVSIALMFKNKPLFGVIYIPVEDKLFFSDPDRGTFSCDAASTLPKQLAITSLIRGAKRVHRSNEEGDRQIKVVVTRSHLNGRTEEILAQMREKFGDVEVAYCGSSKKICMVADGSADIYFRTTQLFDWDIAAGDAILKGVGIELKSLEDDTVIAYNKEELIIKSLIASSVKLHD